MLRPSVVCTSMRHLRAGKRDMMYARRFKAKASDGWYSSKTLLPCLLTNSVGVFFRCNAPLANFWWPRHQERQLAVLPRNVTMNQIDWYLGDILEPDEKMEMQCAPVLELEPVEVALHIWGCGPCLVPKEVVLPAVNVGTTQVSPHKLAPGC